MTTKEQTNTNKTTVEEPIKFKGKFMSVVGKRKRAIAQIRMYKKGSGVIVINDQRINDFFSVDNISLIKQPLKLTGNLKTFNLPLIIR